MKEVYIMKIQGISQKKKRLTGELQKKGIIEQRGNSIRIFF